MKINYNNFAQDYEESRKIDSLVYSTISCLLNLSKGDNILDFGCGTGNYLKQFFLDYKINPYGIEPSINMYKIARKKLNLNCIEYRDHTFLPLMNKVFDKIYTIDVIHHIKQIDIFFNNLKLIAAPKTKFCICTESSSQLKEKYWIKYFPEILEIDLNRFHTIDTIVKTGIETGWIHKKTVTIETKSIEPISSEFMECVKRKTLSALLLISEESYKQGFFAMKKDYESEILIPQYEGYTFVLFERGV